MPQKSIVLPRAISRERPCFLLLKQFKVLLKFSDRITHQIDFHFHQLDSFNLWANYRFFEFLFLFFNCNLFFHTNSLLFSLIVPITLLKSILLSFFSGCWGDFWGLNRKRCGNRGGILRYSRIFVNLFTGDCAVSLR